MNMQIIIDYTWNNFFITEIPLYRFSNFQYSFPLFNFTMLDKYRNALTYKIFKYFYYRRDKYFQKSQ